MFLFLDLDKIPIDSTNWEPEFFIGETYSTGDVEDVKKGELVILNITDESNVEMMFVSKESDKDNIIWAPIFHSTIRDIRRCKK